jgi:hypothetical protein
LIVRTQAPRAFRDSDLDMITARAVSEVGEKVQAQMTQQAEADARALALLDQALNPEPGPPRRARRI